MTYKVLKKLKSKKNRKTFKKRIYKKNRKSLKKRIKKKNRKSLKKFSKSKKNLKHGGNFFKALVPQPLMDNYRVFSDSASNLNNMYHGKALNESSLPMNGHFKR